jgi:hypothetical protein
MNTKSFLMISGALILGAVVGVCIYNAGREEGIKEAKKDKPEDGQGPVIDIPKKQYAEVAATSSPDVDPAPQKALPAPDAHQAPAPVAVAASKPTNAPKPVAPTPVFTHSEDFRVVTFRGEKHELTGTQARVIERLWNAVKAGCPEVHQSKLLEDLGIYSKRLRDVFKADLDIYKILIGRGKRKGVFFLNIA